MTRYSFVVQVHREGVSTLENLATHERVHVVDLATVGPQIARWLRELQLTEPHPAAAQEERDGGAS